MKILNNSICLNKCQLIKIRFKYKKYMIQLGNKIIIQERNSISSVGETFFNNAQKYKEYETRKRIISFSSVNSFGEFKFHTTGYIKIFSIVLDKNKPMLLQRKIKSNHMQVLKIYQHTNRMILNNKTK